MLTGPFLTPAKKNRQTKTAPVSIWSSFRGVKHATRISFMEASEKLDSIPYPIPDSDIDILGDYCVVPFWL